MAQKTNAARILDQMKISYDILTYEADESDLSAGNVAAKIGFPVEKVYKTLVARGDKTGVILASIPGNGELDLKALAALSGNKKVEVVPLKEVQPLTGYIRGGVSPLGTKKKYSYYLEEAALHSRLVISDGQRGYQLVLAPQALIAATKAVTGEITKFQEEHRG